MELTHARCAGLDVHKDTVVACVRVAEGGKVRTDVRTFGTTTTSLMRLGDWLREERVTAVAMEATAVYWKPVWHLLEGEEFGLILANAAHIKAVPGRKTDVNDAMWIADLLAHGLIRSAFVPDAEIQHLRDLTRTRKQFVREKSRHIQRIQKVLQDCNIKLDSVISDITGKSGRAILRAIIAGETSAEELAKLGDARLKATPDDLAEACRGFVVDHHRFLLRLELDEVEHIEDTIAKIEQEAAKALAPFRAQVEALDTIPGIDATAAAVIVAEIGVDMSRFPADDHLISWAGLCPRSDESAGKHRSRRIRKGAPWLRATLVQAAWGAIRTKHSYERTLFMRLKARCGPQKAIVAVARTLLQAAYFLLQRGGEYRSLGTNHFDAVDRTRTKNRLVHRLQKLGYKVEIAEAAC